jgi:hypothetical protein
MAYIGKQPLVGNYISCDSLSASATTTYNLLSSGTPVFPTVPQNCIVSLNGVVQAPVTSFTISGSAIVFSTTLSTTDSIDYITVLGNTLNIGTPSNNTVGLSQFSATGTPSATTFLRGDNAWATPAADLVWQSVQTTNFTADAGKAYPVNTTSAGITVTLPATPAAGNQVQIVDYAGTADTNPIVINPNSNKLESGTGNLQLGGEREGVILTYIDATQGWIPTSGINEGTDALGPVPYSIDFLVIAGGASGGGEDGGGGGAGGYRTSTQTVTGGTVITVTVGDGGAAVSSSPSRGFDGSNSSISGSGLTTITSTGGGGGGRDDASPQDSGKNGGSGGGGGGRGDGGTGPGGNGNTPSTSPSQGNNGGTAFGRTSGFNEAGGGGGGAGAVGGNGSSGTGGNGGNGTASSITGSSVTRAGGGGGGTGGASPAIAGSGGTGGGGAGTATTPSTATSGTANTGSGGGGCGGNNMSGSTTGAGGKGVVILSMATANYSGTTSGSPTITTSGANTILQFNGDGSYTA